jgi:hypothetical protein
MVALQTLPWRDPPTYNHLPMIRFFQKALTLSHPERAALVLMVLGGVIGLGLFFDYFAP